MGYEGSYVWQLRQKVGDRLLLLPGTVVVVEDDEGRVLLQRRADTSEWGAPGGSPEEGDSFLSCALRELREECGLEVSPDEVTAFGSLSDGECSVVTYPDGSKIQGFDLCLAVRRWRGQPHAKDGESEDLRFFRLDDLPSEMLPASRRALELYAAFRESGAFQIA